MPIMSQEKVQALVASLQYTLDQTAKAAAKVPEAARMKQLADGKAHPLWLVGHLAQALSHIVIHWTLGGAHQVPREYGKKFAPGILGGEAITANPADYPAWDEVLVTYVNTGAKALELLAELQDADLDGEPKNMPEQARGVFGNMGQTLVGMIAHDSYHRGQLGLILALDN
jgi:uncharacterized damage-inducible protein DinB